MKILKVISILYGLFVLGIAIAALAVPCNLFDKVLYIIVYPILLAALTRTFMNMLNGKIK